MQGVREMITAKGISLLFTLYCRTLCPCTHCMYAVYALGVVAHNPAAYSPKWQKTAYVDLGIDPGFTDELLREVFQ